MIPEPQRTYVLELLTALGPAADGFVLAGAQAMKFHIENSRATRDFDFILDVLGLRELDLPLSSVLTDLGYAPIPEARNFQFQKMISGSQEIMRIEFMAPYEHKRKNDFRVDVHDELHARACEGGKLVLVESDYFDLEGTLPSGEAATVLIRVIRPTALVVLKILAMDERYRNIRGPDHADHDRNEARVHAEDILAILRAQLLPLEFRAHFLEQFAEEPPLREKVLRIVKDYFDDETKPGLLLYAERLRERLVPQNEIRVELQRAQRLVLSLLVDQCAF